MQGIGDPDLFELSEVVQKSSKSGIFSNRRLLMIKDGYLYYYSNVPSNYKGHQPNLMSTLKQLPKSSIEVRTIRNIRPESQKSSTLIIEFFSKDMIDREDIRKSVNAKSFQHPPVKEESSEIEEWRFTFGNFNKCKQWYFALETLKSHFQKHQLRFDKFTEYMANFDNDLRKSLPRPSSSSINSPKSVQPHLDPTSPPTHKSGPVFMDTKPMDSKVLQSKYQMDNPNIFSIQQTNEQNDDELIASFKKHDELNDLQDGRLSIEKDILETPLKDSHNKALTAIPIQSILQVQDAIYFNRNSTGGMMPVPPINSPRTPSNTSPVPQVPSPMTSKTKIPSQQEISSPVKPVQRGFVISQPKLQKPLLDKSQLENSNKSEQESSVLSNSSVKSPKSIKKSNQQQTISYQKDLKKAIEETAERVREQQRLKAETQSLQFQKFLKERQETINEMQKQLQNNRHVQLQLQQQLIEESLRRQQQERMRMILERQKKEEQEYRKLKQSIGNQPSIEKVQDKQAFLKEESIQTEFERDFIEVLDNTTPQMQHNRLSYSSEIPSPMTINHHNNIRITHEFSHTSQSSAALPDNSFAIENYQYFWELSQLYLPQKSVEKVEKELKLARFIRKATQEATSVIVTYIDENKPKKSIKIERFIFDIQIVCEEGSLLKTQWRERLIYSNEGHQRLKRTFKVYNTLNDKILSILKKKPNYSLRVPFCCLVQYKGYSCLAQIRPSNQTSSHHPHLFKPLGPTFPSFNFQLSDFQINHQTFSLATVTKPYKCTKQDVGCMSRKSNRTVDWLSLNRRNGISICSTKLFEEAQIKENNPSERLLHAKLVSFCRQLKKVMKANTPYIQPQFQFQFFQHFLRDPSHFLEEQLVEGQPLPGLLLYYCEKLLGIKMKSRIGDPIIDFAIGPVVRGMTLGVLDIALFAGKVDRLCSDRKVDLAQQAIQYLRQLEQDSVQILFSQINLSICKQNYAEALERIQFGFQVISVHDPRKLQLISLQAQCHEALEQVQEALSHLRILLQETQYLYQDRTRLVEVYFLIANTFSRQQLHKQLVEVYRTILRESPESRNRVVLEYSQFLLSQDSDPHLLLDFIHQNTKEHFQTPQAQILLGDVYLKCRNIPKAVCYYHSALQTLKTHQDSSQQDLVRVLSRLVESTQNKHQRVNSDSMI